MVKQTVLSLLLAGVAAAASAQPPANPTQNIIVVGAHVLKPGVIAPVEIDILNPTDVAGVQARLLYNSDLFEAVDPTGTDNEGTEGSGSVISGALVTVNYETGAAPVPANGINTKGVNFAVAGVKGSNKTGKLLQIYFRAKAGAPVDASSAVTLDPATDFVVASSTGSLTGSVRPGAFIAGTATAGWSQVIPQGISGSVGAANGQVWVVGDDGLVRAFDAATGAPLANFTGPNVGAPVAGRPVPKEGAVYLATTNGRVHRIDPATGNDTMQDLSGGSATFAILSTPAVLNGLVYVTDNNDTIRALDATTLAQTVAPIAISSGAAAGTQGLSSPAALTPPNTTATTVWVGGADGSLHKYNAADLTPQGTVSAFEMGATPQPVQSSPYINAAGVGFIGSQNGRVYVFDAGSSTLLGSYDTTAPVQNSPFGFGTGQVAVVNSQGQLHVVTAPAMPGGMGGVTGTNPGTLKFTGGAGPNESPIVLGNTIWVGDVNGVLHSADLGGAAGTVKDIKVSGSSLSSPGVPAANTIAIASADGSVVALPTQ